MTSAPSLDTRWEPLSAESVAELFGGTSARWWLSGGVALDRWLGESIRDRVNIDVSTTRSDVAQLVAALPARYSAWIPDGDDAVRAWPVAADVAGATEDADLQPVRVHDDETGAWVLQINVEDGSPRGWLYLRDPRLQLPWDRAVLDIDGIPTGAPEVQLVWKALRPRPEDELDKDAVFPRLSDEARAWWEKAILSIHPHSTWSIHVRSPLTPAKASWNRPRR